MTRASYDYLDHHLIVDDDGSTEVLNAIGRTVARCSTEDAAEDYVDSLHEHLLPFE